VTRTVPGKIILARMNAARVRVRRGLRLSPLPLGPLVDDLHALDPAVARAIHPWFAGDPIPDLDGVRAVFYFMQDPLRERFPEEYSHATALAEAARARGIRIVNPPENLSNTVKSRQARLWRDAGIPTPWHLPFSSYDELMALADTCPSYPVVVRSDVLHVQEKMRICRDAAELRAMSPGDVACPGAVAEFVDTRESHRAAAPESEWGRFFHKKRSLVAGRHVANVHVFFGPTPIVGLSNSTFRHYRDPNPLARWLATRRCRAHIGLDNAFTQAPAEHPELMQRAAATLGLDFLAIDYATRADGSPVLWEANPYFAMHMFPRQILAGPRRMKARLRRFHILTLAFLRDLLEDPR
jgi:hypothetical protein